MSGPLSNARAEPALGRPRGSAAREIRKSKAAATTTAREAKQPQAARTHALIEPQDLGAEEDDQAEEDDDADCDASDDLGLLPSSLVNATLVGEPPSFECERCGAPAPRGEVGVSPCSACRWRVYVKTSGSSAIEVFDTD